MSHKRKHFVGNVVTLCEIEDQANFCRVVSRGVFPDSHRARLWADAEIQSRRLQAIRKFGDDFDEALFGLKAEFQDIEFDPARPALATERPGNDHIHSQEAR